MRSHRPFHPRRAPAAVLLCLGTLVAPAAHALQGSGNAALITDYVWRGSTQTQGDPAVQAGFKMAGDSGFYGMVWGSNVKFAPETRASSELDFIVGWSGQLSDTFALDVNLTHYRYPSTAVDLDWTEVIATAMWHQNWWLTVGYSNDALAADEAGTYTQIGAKFPIGDAFRIEAAVGRYWLDDVYGEDYAHAQLGAVWAFKAPFELRVTLHDTDGAARRLFPGLAGSRVEAALQASF